MNIRLEDIVDLKELPEQFSVQCPFCPPHYQDGKFKMGINLEKDVYHCWRCNAKGKASELFLRFTGINKIDLLNYSFEKKNTNFDPNRESYYGKESKINISAETKEYVLSGKEEFNILEFEVYEIEIEK
jgi:hypothetical protein